MEQSGREVRLKGLVDTGNSLTDPLTGQPVCIVEREAVESLMENTQKRRYIGFRSVGNEYARLLLVQFDSLSLTGKEKSRSVISGLEYRIPGFRQTEHTEYL